MKDVILVTPNNVEDNNSPRGPRLSAGSLSTQTSSNQSSPANSNDSSGKRSSGNHEVLSSDSSKCLFSPKPPVNMHVLS